MGVLGVIFCLIVAVVACCECALIRDEARPVVETEVQLTAEDADAGNWTANLGDIEVEIEHRHGDTSPQKGDFWVMDVTRKLYEEQNSYEESENNALLTEDNDKFRDETEMPQEDIEQSTAEGLVVNKPAEEPSDMSNDIADDDIFALKQRAGIYFPPATDYPIPEDYHVEADIYNNEDNYDSDEVVLDPDNYEYFKGVGWFKLDDRHLNWVDARAACAEVGAHLAVPDTQERVLVFMTLFKRHSDIPARAVLRQQVYVGVSDPGMNRQFTTVQVPPVPPQQSHRSDYDLVPNHGYYKLHTSAKTWDEARRICLSEGSRLLVLNSAEEFTAIKALWERNPNFIDTMHKTYIHVGLKKNEANNFVTDSGVLLSNVGYAIWGTNEPNNANGKESCLSVKDTGGLNDVTCELKLAFMCEQEA